MSRLQLSGSPWLRGFRFSGFYFILFFFRILFLIEILIEIIVDSYAVVRSNRGLCILDQGSPSGDNCRTIV